MKTITLHDLEQLSASLDRQLPQAEQARLDLRVKASPEWAAALGELRQTRDLLRHTPRRRAPHNFMLTPRMTGVKPPLPRLVPVFSWASAVSLLLFFFTLGTNMLGKVSFGAAAPMPVSAPVAETGMATQEDGIMLAVVPEDTVGTSPTTTPALYALNVPDAPPDPEARQAQPPQELQPKNSAQVNPWLILWLALAAGLSVLAIVIRWRKVRLFRIRNQYIHIKE